MSHNAARISRQIVTQDLRACLFLRENSLRVSIEAPLLSASFAFVEQLITVTVRGSGWHRLRHHPRPRLSKSHLPTLSYPSPAPRVLGVNLFPMRPLDQVEGVLKPGPKDHYLFKVEFCDILTVSAGDDDQLIARVAHFRNIDDHGVSPGYDELSVNCKILQLYCIVNAFNVSFYTMANWVIDRKLVNTLMIREKIPNQQELAKHSGVGYHHLSRLFAGNGWDHRTLSRLCTALQCGPQEILLKV